MKKNTKKFQLSLKSLTKDSKNTNWQKGVYLALLLVVFFFMIGCGYLLFRRTPNSIKEVIDEEINSSDIYFKESTLEEVRDRQNPAQNIGGTTGKNPFTPF